MLKYFYPTYACLLLSTLAFTPLFAQGGLNDCNGEATVSVAFSGATEITTCTDDDVMDRVRFQVKPFVQSFAYVIVDEADIIQYINFSNFINFDLLPGGVLKVYAFSNYGRITAKVGDTFTGAELSRPCFALTENFVTVNNSASGDIVIESEQDSYSVCPGDGVADVITVTSPALNVTYLITTPSGDLLDTSTSGEIDFEAAGSGVCYVYAFAGTLPGNFDNVSELEGLDGCGEGLSNNFIVVDRQATAGGTITTNSGRTDALTCPNDGVNDVIEFVVEGNSADNNQLVVTNEENVIIGLPTALSINFEGFDPGTCRVYNFAYTGTFTGMVGDTLGVTTLASGCTDVSDNFVRVIKSFPLGGTIATTGGETEVNTCPGDGLDDIIEVAVSGNASGFVAYVITTDQDTVLGVRNQPSFNVEGAGVGVCRIWSVTYQGELLIDNMTNIALDQLATSCFALSDNFITVNRTVPAGGTVATVDGETEITTCPGDGLDDIFTFVSTGAAEGSFTFLVTDENNVIIAVPEGDMVNFEGAGNGVCRLWGLSYTGDLLAADGLDAASATLASSCFSLSDNFVTVNREQPEGGTVALSGGGTDITVCPGDGSADVLNFVSENGSGENFAFLITNEVGQYLMTVLGTAVDFENVPVGICRVYGIYYTGELTLTELQELATTSLATGCFALSDNFITVNRKEAATGPIQTADGTTEILVCPGDRTPDVFFFDSTGTTLSNFLYLVVDENDVLVQVPFTDRIDFNSLPEGVCRVFGFGFDGAFLGRLGDTLGVDILASQCNAFSENFVTVTKQVPQGGTVATVDGATEVSVCSQDGVSDLIEVVSTGASGQNFTYLITTDENVVLEVSTNSTFDFDIAPLGICRVWGLSYQGDLIVSTGDTVGVNPLASLCADLSDNFVTVRREDPDGGTVSATGGLTEVFTCPGDGVPDLIRFFANGDVGGNYAFAITDVNDVVIDIVTGDSFDFEPAPPGICRIWGIAYAGNLTVGSMDTLTNTELADGCFALSDNFITVTREVPEGGAVSLPDGVTTSVQVCSGVDSEPATVFATTSASTNYTYLIVQADSFALTSVNDSFNFNRADGGEYLIYGLAYTGNLDIFPGQNIFTTDLATSCFELSDNFITVNVTEVDGGTILGNDAEIVYFCPENENDGLVEFTTNSRLSEENYRYVITTNTDFPVVIEVIPAGDTSYNFDVFPLMDLRVYAISHTGDFLAAPGTALLVSPLATGCAAVSDNFITVFNDTPEAGAVSPDGLPPTNIFCTVNGDSTLSVTTTSESLTGYAVIVTDTSNVVQLVSLDPSNVALGTLPEGDYRIYGLAYTGNVTVVAGDDLATTILADNCFELTADFAAVTNGGSVEAGRLINITTEDQRDTITFCGANGDNPVVILESTTSSENFRYIVTDADNRVRVANLPSNVIPLQNFGPGEYRIYGVSFTGTLLINVNRILDPSFLSSGCGALTENFITVIYTDPDGGSVFTADGETTITVEIEGAGDTATAQVDFISTSDSLDNYVFVVTDDSNNILGLNTTGTVDFGPAGVGVCRVWGLAYTGNILVGQGDNIEADILTDGCFALSDNFVAVTRVDEAGVNGEGQTEIDHPEISVLQMTVRPNPASGATLYLDLSSHEALPDGLLYVRNMNGVMYGVKALGGGMNATTVSLDISTLPSGMYFVQLATEDGMQSVRFMKN